MKFFHLLQFLLLLNMLSSCERSNDSQKSSKAISFQIEHLRKLATIAPDSALIAFEKLSKTNSTLNHAQLAEVRMGIADAKFELGFQDSAIHEISNLVNSLTQKNDTLLLLKSLTLQGKFFIKRDLNVEARKVFEKGLKLAESTHQIRYAVRFRQGIATSLMGLKHYSSAIHAFKNVLAEGISSNDSELIAVTYQNLAMAYHQKEDYTTAKNYQLLALNFNQNGIKSTRYAEMLNNLGTYFSANHQLDSAMQCYLASERIYRNLKNPYGTIQSRFNQANVKLRQHQLKEAEKAFISLLVDVKRHKIVVGEFYIINSLAEVQELAGNYQQSLSLYDSSLNFLIKNEMKHLGNQVITNRFHLIKDQLKLDSTDSEWKKQNYYESLFKNSLEAIDLNNQDLKKSTINKNITNKTDGHFSENKFYWLSGISCLMVLIVFSIQHKQKNKSKNRLQPERLLNQHPELSQFPEKLNLLLNQQNIWSNSLCSPLMLAELLSLKIEVAECLSQHFFKSDLQDLLHQKRIEYACQQLENSPTLMQSMDELAMAAGFENTIQFYKVFSTKTGMQPSNYWASKKP